MSERCISIVLPVYNESENIVPCLRGLRDALAGHVHEILVCYDFDEDTTLPAIAAMPDPPDSVRLVKNTLGRGVLHAIRAGFAAARGDVVVTTMADLSDPPELIPRMAERIRDGADVVSGSRYMAGGSQQGGPLLKRTLSRLAGLSLRWIAKLGTCDATSNFRAYSRAFLRRVTIESRSGFEVALELTVKAHLHGSRVDEIASSWVDRSAGRSRFRMWKWMPSYLRWYLPAVAAPVLCLLALAVLSFLGLARAAQAGGGQALSVVTVLALTGLAAAALGLARSLRGRTTLRDLAQPFLWMLPWQLGRLGLLSVATIALASLGWVGWTCGWSRLCSSLAAGWSRLAPRANPSTVGIVLALLLVWLAKMILPGQIPDNGLDLSWGGGLGYAMRHGWKAGVDYAFTFGPLGYLASSTFDPVLFPIKTWIWECGVKLLFAGFCALAAMRCQSPLNRTLMFLLLILLPIDADPYTFLSMVAVAACAIERPERSGLTAAGMLVLAALSLVKFTYSVLALPCALGIACARTQRSSLRAGTWTFLLYPGWLFALWLLSGQSLTNVLPYLRRSMQMAGGYSEAMSMEGKPELVTYAWVIVALCLALIASQVLSRPRRFPAVVLGGIHVAAIFVAYKSGFVRRSDHTPLFFGFTAVAPFLISPGSAPGALRRTLEAGTRLACMVLSLVGMGTAMEFGSYAPASFVAEASQRINSNAVMLLDLETMKRSWEEDLEKKRRVLDLPRTREVVGRETIDMVSYEQGLILLMGLNWRPRPVFQGYATFTPELLEANARLLESDRAPTFVLFQLESVDDRLPTMDDGEALKVLARDYQPVLLEKGYLLLRRSPRAREAEPPALELETSVAFGEELDLRGLRGDSHLLSLEIRYSAWGRLSSFLDQAPSVTMELVTRAGKQSSYRVVPGMMRTGAIIDPLIRTQSDWVAWLVGEHVPRLGALRVLVPSSPAMYEPKIGVKIWRAPAPRPDPDARRRLEWSVFRMTPTRISSAVGYGPATVDGQEVLVVHAPSEMHFELAPGPHVLHGTFGLRPESYLEYKTDGASFGVALEGGDGQRTLLFDRLLDPLRVENDRGTQALNVDFEVRGPASLVLTTGTGPKGDGLCDWAYWGALALDEDAAK